MERKEQWLRILQAERETEFDSVMVRVTYQIYNPETEQQRKFFNGPVVEYWIIQTQENADKEVTPHMKKVGRETLLDRVLGYDVELTDRTTRRRKSTTDFTETQEWHKFLETLKETEFDSNGFEFPDSEEFWKLERAYGYARAQDIAIEQLRARLHARLG